MIDTSIPERPMPVHTLSLHNCNPGQILDPGTGRASRWPKFTAECHSSIALKAFSPKITPLA